MLGKRHNLCKKVKSAVVLSAPVTTEALVFFINLRLIELISYSAQHKYKMASTSLNAFTGSHMSYHEGNKNTTPYFLDIELRKGLKPTEAA